MRLNKEDVRGYLFISPWIIGFTCFFVFPMVYAIYISLTNWKVTSGDFVGLNNDLLLLQDPMRIKRRNSSRDLTIRKLLMHSGSYLNPMRRSFRWLVYRRLPMP